MTRGKTYTPKTIDSWRKGQNAGGVNLRKDSVVATVAEVVEASGIAPPAPLGKNLDAAYQAVEHKTAASRLKAEAETALKAATAKQAEADALGAVKAARAGDFEKVLDLVETDYLADAENQLRKATRVLNGCTVAVVACERDLVAEVKGEDGRDWLAYVWASGVTAPYLGDSLREMRAHEEAAKALHPAVARLALMSDPGVLGDHDRKTLRNALRPDETGALPAELPTVEGLKAAANTAKVEAAEAKAAKAEAAKVENAETARANALELKRQRTEALA